MINEKIVIVVVDSGIDCDNPIFRGHKYDGIGITFDSTISELKFVSSFQDEYGHGTAVCSILHKQLVENQVPYEFYIVKIFEKDMHTSDECLIAALEYINNYISCNIIHLSLGVSSCSKINELHAVCKKLFLKGIILISAFDNMGSISYPAVFDEVIGVDGSGLCTKTKEFVFVENSVVNVFAKAGVHRVTWLNNKKMLIEGTSFSAAYITAFVAKCLKGKKNVSFKEICDAIRDNAVFREANEVPLFESFHFLIPKKAVVFPFNKEIHSLRRFENELSFKILGYYDSVYSRHVNKFCDELIGGCNISNTDVIKNINSLNWESDFDTLILGHVGQLSNLLGLNILDIMVSKCCQHRKHLFSFDSLDNYKEISEKYPEINFYSPGIYRADNAINQYGKLFRINRPVLGVFGTSSKQGKFTVQLNLRYRFIKEGYSVGQIGTEPHSELFNIDYSVPIGYNYNINVNEDEFILIVNDFMHQIELRAPDIIIIGSQSSTVPFDFGNTKYFSAFQQQFLFATVPDCVVLVVNLHDDFSYIKRTICYLNSISKVIAISVYPVLTKNALGGMSFKERLGAFGNKVNVLEDEFGLPVFMQDSPEDFEHLFRTCEEYFVSE